MWQSFISRSLSIDHPTIEVRQRVTQRWQEIAWSPDGKLVATAATGKLAVWSAANWSELTSWETRATNWIAWQNDSRHLWSSGWSGHV